MQPIAQSEINPYSGEMGIETLHVWFQIAKGIHTTFAQSDVIGQETTGVKSAQTALRFQE